MTATFWVLASGTPSPSYQWHFNGTAISGATSSIYSITNTQLSNAGSYTVTASNTLGTVISSSATLTVNASGTTTAPVITQQPSSQTIASGTTVVFTASVNGTQAAASSASPIWATSVDTRPGATTTRAASVTYQWFWNNSAILGATDSTYVLTDATSANDGSYACLVINSAGSVMTKPATLNIVQASEPGHLINISCRAQSGTGANQLIAGFVVGGGGTSGSQTVLIRASGPALVPFGVTDTLPDPQLTLNNSSGVLATNNGWGGNALISSTGASVGAFAWVTLSSHDSALLESLTGGAYTAQVTGSSGDTGVALAEIYDATASYTLTQPRLINISARVQVGTGGNALIAGFVIGGSTSKTVLIRASGPALIPFGVQGTLPDPELQLYSTASGSSLLATNVGWGGDPQLSAAAASVGAFSWGSLSTADSAILITLPPGPYTANISGASGDTGVALVEVYEVQ